MNFEVPRFTVWPFRSHTIRSITRLSTEHKPLSNWADKVLNQQTHSSGNKLRHSALKYDVNLFQYRAFHYPWTTEDCNQIVLCNFKPRDKLFPMYSIFFFFFFLRPKTFNQTFFSFFFSPSAGHPLPCKWLAQIPCTSGLFDLVSLCKLTNKVEILKPRMKSQ